MAHIKNVRTMRGSGQGPTVEELRDFLEGTLTESVVEVLTFRSADPGTNPDRDVWSLSVPI